MTWTDASIEAMTYGFNGYRDAAGRIRPLVQRFASLSGDWMIQGGRIVSTERYGPDAPASYSLVRMVPPPARQQLDALETRALDVTKEFRP